LNAPHDEEIAEQVDDEDEIDVSDDSDVNDELDVQAASNIPGLIRQVQKLTRLTQCSINVFLPILNVETHKGKRYRKQ
jgi:hypothetical protein